MKNIEYVTNAFTYTFTVDKVTEVSNFSGEAPKGKVTMEHKYNDGQVINTVINIYSNSGEIFEEELYTLQVDLIKLHEKFPDSSLITLFTAISPPYSRDKSFEKDITIQERESSPQSRMSILFNDILEIDDFYRIFMSDDFGVALSDNYIKRIEDVFKESNFTQHSRDKNDTFGYAPELVGNIFMQNFFTINEIPINQNSLKTISMIINGDKLKLKFDSYPEIYLSAFILKFYSFMVDTEVPLKNTFGTYKNTLISEENFDDFKMSQLMGQSQFIKDGFEEGRYYKELKKVIKNFNILLNDDEKIYLSEFKKLSEGLNKIELLNFLSQINKNNISDLTKIIHAIKKNSSNNYSLNIEAYNKITEKFKEVMEINDHLMVHSQLFNALVPPDNFNFIINLMDDGKFQGSSDNLETLKELIIVRDKNKLWHETYGETGVILTKLSERLKAHEVIILLNNFIHCSTVENENFKGSYGFWSQYIDSFDDFKNTPIEWFIEFYKN